MTPSPRSLWQWRKWRSLRHWSSSTARIGLLACTSSVAATSVSTRRASRSSCGPNAYAPRQGSEAMPVNQASDIVNEMREMADLAEDTKLGDDLLRWVAEVERLRG